MVAERSFAIALWESLEVQQWFALTVRVSLGRSRFVNRTNAVMFSQHISAAQAIRSVRTSANFFLICEVLSIFLQDGHEPDQITVLSDNFRFFSNATTI